MAGIRCLLMALHPVRLVVGGSVELALGVAENLPMPGKPSSSASALIKPGLYVPQSNYVAIKSLLDKQIVGGAMGAALTQSIPI